MGHADVISNWIKLLKRLKRYMKNDTNFPCYIQMDFAGFFVINVYLKMDNEE